MIILLDTNIVLDVLLKREEFYENSYNVIRSAINKGDKIFFSSSSITDVYYIIQKIKHDKNQALECIELLVQIMDIATVNEDCILKALLSRINDFEDALVDSIAESIGADYIITRNINDFENSLTNCLTPIEYTKKLVS